MLGSVETIQIINTLVKKESPFLFIINFEGDNNVVLPLNQLKANNLYFSVPGFKNYEVPGTLPSLKYFKRNPVSFIQYQSLFNRVMDEIKRGNTFLVNLTVPTPVTSNLDLFELFLVANAKYKLFYDNQFALFSPETFISIDGNIIKTFPMKGTIRADVPNALEIILNDTKEAAEHATIVDLLRNDISRVATNVEVSRYRYAELLSTNFGPIYQVSSEIQGKLPEDFKNNFGEMLFSLLPAGSVTGAPKDKTVQIINEVELCSRQFYTGVFGIWNTKRLDSAVMIRFIRNDNGTLYYHSGGGITFQSNCESEYKEIIDKVYVPVC